MAGLLVICLTRSRTDRFSMESWLNDVVEKVNLGFGSRRSDMLGVGMSIDVVESSAW